MVLYCPSSFVVLLLVFAFIYIIFYTSWNDTRNRVSDYSYENLLTQCAEVTFYIWICGNIYCAKNCLQRQALVTWNKFLCIFSRNKIILATNWRSLSTIIQWHSSRLIFKNSMYMISWTTDLFSNSSASRCETQWSKTSCLFFIYYIFIASY